MNEKAQMEESVHAPLCPHCKASLRKLHWHKVKGHPGTLSYLVLISCPQCRTMLGSAAT